MRRFNVRWVMRADKPPNLGDPATEKRFGRYVVRELPDWDGRFARVERGSGEVLVTHLDDERVDVELSGTTEPALVALGMGYYPRWQATHAQRGALPVYALPATPGADTHVPAAWLPPGKTSFRPTGPLPSDGKGRGLAALAASLAIAIAVVWGRLPTARLRLLSSAARGRAWLRQRRQWLGAGVAGMLLLGLLLAGIITSRAPARALQVGSGLLGGARVEVRTDGEAWRSCRYSPLHGGYRCPGRVFVQDTVTGLLNDASPSLAFTVPAIHVAASGATTELRIQVEARLAGEYWAGTNGGRVHLAIGGEAETTLTGNQSRHVFEATSAPRRMMLLATVSSKRALQVAFVQRERLDPERGYVAAPERSPW